MPPDSAPLAVVYCDLCALGEVIWVEIDFSAAIIPFGKATFFRGESSLVFLVFPKLCT